MVTTMSIQIFVNTIVAGILISLAASAARADVFLQEMSTGESADDIAVTQHDANIDDGRLLIFNGNTAKVIFDDGRNDPFCVTRKVIAF